MERTMCGEGVSVTAYNSIDEMEADMRTSREAADALVTPWQEKIDVGQYAVAKCCEGELAYCEILKKYTGKMKHYRFAKSFSVFCPDGELGDVHVSELIQGLSKEEFEAARQHGWKSN